MADGSGHGFAEEASAFLGVERSLTGRAWRLRPADPALVRAHRARHDLSEPVARALAARGIDEAGAPDFLRPTLKAQFPDPSCFLDMDRAAALIVDAVAAGRRCAVFADYDVDGAASGALLVRWFRAVGAELDAYVPDRLTEGYGPSAAAFAKLKASGAELVVTVDCGAAAHEALAAAAAMDLPVVVVDHHLMRPGEAPPAAALVNPNHPGCGSGQGVLCAAGVVFVLLAALNREARARGLFGPDRAEPDLRRWLDLAALGAVCDVTRLTGFNRALTALGLKRMGAWENPGLAALAEAAGARGEPSTFHAGFLLGPRINAGGRIGRADLGLRLLSTDDPDEARALAAELDALNGERRTVEAEALDAAAREAAAELARDPDTPVIVVAGADWHPGVVGVVAGRLRERFRRPAVVIGLDAAGVGKGSGRSQPGVNLGAAVGAAWEAGLLLAGGGHAMAAGLTVRAERLDELRAFLRARLAPERLAAEAADQLEFDGLLAPAACDRELWTGFQALGPFGPGNVEPLFVLAGVRVACVRPVRGGHVRVDLQGGEGGRLRAVAWRAADTAVGAALLAAGAVLDVAGRLKPDDWMGREGVEFEIEDVADPRRAA